MFVLKSTLVTAKKQLDRAAVFYRSVCSENARLRGALETIVSQETRSPNATVTRILNVAKDALGNSGTQEV